MSESELHIPKARLVGGVLNKARRAELKMRLPVWLDYDEEDRVVLDPDQQVQQSLRVFFSPFERTGSAWATVQAFGRQGLKFPQRGRARRSEIAWHLQRSHRLKSRRQRLWDQGWLTVYEIAALLGCKWGRISYWRNAGLLESIKFSDKNDRLYRKPSAAAAAEIMRRQRRTHKNHNSQPSQLGAV